MRARSTTFDGMPSRISSGLEMIMDEVRPALGMMEGCVGMSCLADRETGEVIVTTSWDSNPAMQASLDELADLRSQLSQTLGGGMHIDEWSIGLMHHGEHAMFARVEWVHGDTDMIVRACREMCLPDLQTMEGFCGASVLFNPAANLCTVTTSYLDLPTLIESRGMAQHLRENALPEGEAHLLRSHEYELTYAHLNVPEMV